jgi:hypothetical protein
MKDFSFLNRKIWYNKPNIDKLYFELIKERDKYNGVIYKYIETDFGLSKRIKEEIINNKNE